MKWERDATPVPPLVDRGEECVQRCILAPGRERVDYDISHIEKKINNQGVHSC